MRQCRLPPAPAAPICAWVLRKIMDATSETRPNPQSLPGVAGARPVAVAAIVVAVIATATILGAWFFQYVLGYKPCPLCLEQRYVYYFGIPLAVLIILGESVGSSRKVLIFGLLAIAAGMLWNTGLSTYHAGIEWKWWPGPPDCSGSLDHLTAPGSVLDTIKVVRCDEAAWRFLGLSLAGYDALISAALAAVAAWGAWMGWRYGSSSVSQ
jgi:disulfide bond formation protein DsbB